MDGSHGSGPTGRRRRLAIHVGSLTSGGAERVAVALGDHFVDRGWDVAIITGRGTETDFYTFSPSIKRIVLGVARTDEGETRLGALLRRLVRLRRSYQAFRPDVILTMMTRENILGTLASLGTGIPVVASERNYPPARPLSRPWELLRRLVYRLVDVHVVQTTPIRDWIRDRTHARRISIIPNSLRWPIPSSAPRLEPDSVLDPSEKIVLAVGSKAWQKGFDLLADAFAKTAESAPGWKLVIVGLRATLDADHRTERVLREKSSSPNLAGRVLILDRAGNIGDWYERADIFALSSRFEGFPNVLLEAMASGKPCVAFDCKTGPSELIENGVNGVLVSDGDTDALAAALARLMSHPEERERLGAAAVNVRETFEPGAIMARWEAVVEELAPAPFP